ncbi:hypothetical protein OSB04_un001421, partial [Centaurea solstitialis]
MYFHGSPSFRISVLSNFRLVFRGLASRGPLMGIKKSSCWSTSKVSRSMRPAPDVPFSREGNRVNKVAIRMNGSSLGLSFAPRGAGSNPVRDNHKAFDHRISRDPA